MRQSFSSYIIGDTTLAIRCAELLLERRHVLRGIVSDAPEVLRWANGRGLDVIDPGGELSGALGARPYDYLFSIVNSRILRADVLRTPARGAINYHDSPLPRYAGTHATSWGILHREPTWAVTWHLIAEAVDAGAILKQPAVEIAPDDTALSLNAKCYEAAAASFAELVDELATGRATETPQDLSARTYFPRARRPEAAAVIAWERSASEISALVRALDFGPYPNPLGRPKVLVGDAVFVCPQVEVLDQRASAPPGTLLSVEPTRLVVSTADRAVAIPRLLSLDGAPAPLPEVSRQFDLRAGARLSELAASTRERISAIDASAAKHERHWVERLRAPRPATLPYLASNSASTEPRPLGRIGVLVPPSFHRYVTEQGVEGTAADAIAAVAAIYVARVTDELAFDLALDISDALGEQEAAALERLFATIIPVRIELNEEAPFGAVLAQVGRALGAARRRGAYARDVVSRYPPLRGAGGGASTPPIAFSRARAGAVPLTIVVAPDESSCTLAYDRGALADADAHRLAGHLATLLSAIPADASRPVRALPLLTDAERQQILVEWNRTDADFPRAATVHGLIEAQAARSPDAVAVTFGDETLTFAELDRRANQWAHRLHAHGVGPGVLVGLHVERSPDLVVGLLAILKAGGAYVPLDPSYPAERTAYMIGDAALRVLLTQSSLRDRLEAPGCTVLEMDAPPVSPVLDERSAVAAPDSGVTAHDLVYVIYTSGSTGLPKGVLIHHRGVVNYLTWYVRALDVGGGTGAPVQSSIAFDLTVTSVLVPLVAGRPVHLLHEGEGVEALATALRRHANLSLVKITPAHLELLGHQLAPTELPGRTRALVIGGEALTGDTIAVWQRHAPETLIVNSYGPTETVVGCCAYILRGGEPIAGSVPLGRPIANVRLYVLDRHRQPLPVGVPGELYIGGVGVARGYLNRPHLTAERFIPDPFHCDDGRRLYRTGDRVRWLGSGDLEFLGRIDRQVKIRGYRIEPGEIEAVLTEHPAVRDAVVIARGEGTARRLLAFAVIGRGAATPLELRSWLAERLPKHMTPSAVVILDTLPLTPNGKIDHAALPEPTHSRADGRPEPPRTYVERVLVEVWEEMLEIPVGITDDFFDLGGHSLLAVRMIQRVGEILGRKPSLPAMFSRPTIEHIAGTLVNLDAPDRPPIAKVREGSGGVTPFFFFHGDFNGTGYYAHRVIAHLRPEQPVYLLAPHEPGGADSVEAMAADRLGQIRAVQPHGPYMLGGLCNGAAVAFETARLLTEEGERVELLAMINVANRTARFETLHRGVRRIGGALGVPPERQVDLFLSLRDRVLWNLSALPPLVPGAPARDRARFAGALAVRMARKAAGRIADRLGGNGADLKTEEQPSDDDTEFDSHRRGDRDRGRYHARLMQSFVPRFYPGRTTLIWWEWSGALEYEQALHGGDPTRGWGRVSGSVDVRVLPGPNRTVLTRSTEALGRELATLLAAAQDRAAALGGR